MTINVCKDGSYHDTHLNKAVHRTMSTLMYVLLVSCVLASVTVHDVASMESRSRRSPQDKRSFTPAEKHELVLLHNQYRSQEPATDMMQMEWNNDLEVVAQTWADRCVWTHSSYGNYKVEQFSYIGENLFAFTDVPTPLKVVKDWADEKAFYDYSTGGCTKVCGHYTQVVWSTSYTVGCGVTHCPSIQGLDWERYGGGYVVVCNYGPGGNIVGRQPFARGQQCSECPKDYPYCLQGLCSRKKTVSSGKALGLSTSTFLLALFLSFVSVS